MPASFVVTFCRRGPCFSRRVRLLLIIIAVGISVSAETRKPIYRIRQYCEATSEYSPIRSIGLTVENEFLVILKPAVPNYENANILCYVGTLFFWLRYPIGLRVRFSVRPRILTYKITYTAAAVHWVGVNSSASHLVKTR